jgi:ribonuclease Z
MTEVIITGTGLRLAEAGTRCRDLRALFVTHHHSDHLTGLQDVLFGRWLEMHGDFRPLPVVAPFGPSITFLEAMMLPWADDIEIRRAHTGREDRPDPEIAGFDAGPNPIVVWESEGVRVTAVAVHHEPVSPSVAYRVDAADGADVLIHEVFRTELVRPFMADLPHLAGIADYHADAAALAEMAHRVGVPTLVLTHLIPSPRDGEDEMRIADDMASAGYDGEVMVARDLTTVSF